VLRANLAAPMMMAIDVLRSERLRVRAKEAFVGQRN
jgi:hypothetical protein